MPVSKKPRKKYQPIAKEVLPTILMPDQKDKLAMPIHTALVRASMGMADEEDWHTCAAAINIALVIAGERGDLPQLLALLGEGAAVMSSLGKDLNKCTKEQATTLGLAINAADNLNSHVSVEEYQAAVGIVMQFTQEAEDVVFHESV